MIHGSRERRARLQQQSSSSSNSSSERSSIDGSSSDGVEGMVVSEAGSSERGSKSSRGSGRSIVSVSVISSSTRRCERFALQPPVMDKRYGDGSSRYHG